MDCAGGLVEVAGGLVGQHDGRPADQGSGDGDPLALPAGELGGASVGAAGQADQFEGVEGPGSAFGLGDPGVEEPVGHVVEDGLVLGQEELLEHEPDPGRPQRGQLPVAHGGHVEAGDADVARLGRSRLPMRCSRVVLPDPDGPTMATTRPRSTVKLTPRRAVTGGWHG